MTAVDGSPTLGDALTRHYAEQGLPADGGEHNAWFRVRLGRVSIPLPNPPARRNAVFFHDANHVLTGYDTVFSGGEMSIAAFEVGTGCGRVWIAWFINLFLMALGIVARPRASFRAFVRGRRSVSIYERREERAALRRMSVAEMRDTLRVGGDTAEGTARDYASFILWSAIAWLVIATSVAPVVAIGWIAWVALRAVGG